MSEEGKAARDDDSDSSQLNLLGRVQQLETEGRFADAAALISAALPVGPAEIPKAQLTLARRAVSLFTPHGRCAIGSSDHGPVPDRSGPPRGR